MLQAPTMTFTTDKEAGELFVGADFARSSTPKRKFQADRVSRQEQQGGAMRRQDEQVQAGSVLAM